MKKIKFYIKQLYKIFSQYFFFFLYGKPREILYPSEEKNIKLFKVKKNDNQTYDVYEIKNGILYTTRVEDVALILNKKLISGPSFQLRKTENITVKFEDISKNIILKIGTPNFQKKIDGNVFSLLTGGGGNKNYFHWLFDVLPRLSILEDCEQFDKVDFFLVPSYKEKHQTQTLDILNIPKDKILDSRYFKHIKANNIIATNHPHTKREYDQDKWHLPIWIIEWLRKNFLKHINEKEYPKKIYIKRNGLNEKNIMRSIVNEEEVITCLKKFEFEIIDLNDLNFLDQVNLFNKAKCIVGLHGAGFSNLVFSNKNIKILEFRSKNKTKTFESICSSMKINYNSIIQSPTNMPAIDQQGHINISVAELENKIKEILN